MYTSDDQKPFNNIMLLLSKIHNMMLIDLDSALNDNPSNFYHSQQYLELNSCAFF